MIHGFIVIDKPEGPTSHGVVAAVRRILKEKKVGHTGTLDPFATGVLPVAVGDATKAIPYLDEAVKEYRAVMCLGTATDTQDSTGRVTGSTGCCGITGEMISEAFDRFTGTISQLPPMYSAVKLDGIPLYKRARKGEEVERASREITVHSISIQEMDLPFVTFSVVCSRGTYVRTLAADLGDFLGCGAHLTSLRRLRSGPFDEGRAVSLDVLQELHDSERVSGLLITPLQALSHLRELQLTMGGARMVSNGRVPGAGDFIGDFTQVLQSGEKVRLSFGERLAAVAESVVNGVSEQEKTIRLLRVFS